MTPKKATGASTWDMQIRLSKQCCRKGNRVHNLRLNPNPNPLHPFQGAPTRIYTYKQSFPLAVPAATQSIVG